jgi:hypothetical protein
LFVASPRVRYAFTLKLRGEYQAAGLLVDAALTSAQSAAANGNELPRVRVNLAAIAAFKGLRTEVFESLEKAYSAGLRDYRILGQDPLFREYRTDPRFGALMGRMQAAPTMVKVSLGRLPVRRKFGGISKHR